MTSTLDPISSSSVSLCQVEKIAENFLLTPPNSNTSPFSGKFKSAKLNKIKETKALLTSKNDTALFIINYEDAGFVIVAGDKRLKPILAYSPTGSFPTDFGQCPAAPVEWLMMIKDYVEKIKEKKEKVDPITETTWNAMLLQQSTTPIDPPPSTCTDEYLDYGPLLRTSWGQGMDYNTYMPPVSTCTHALAGCAAVAMGQVMKYYNFPTDNNHHFFWSIMPNNNFIANNGLFEVARLLKCITDSLKPVYGCSLTTVTQDKISPTFIDDFYFSSAITSLYDFETVKNNIIANRPVLLMGSNADASDQHVWVCDGYSYSKYCLHFNGVYYGINEFKYFHMNWGLNGNCDGLYSIDNFNPLEIDPIFGNHLHNYNYSKSMVYNIIPNNN